MPGLKVLEVSFKDYDSNKNFYDDKIIQLNFILIKYYQEQNNIINQHIWKFKYNEF